jgi:hypothetical protein
MFEELARMESDCSSAKRGGDLGFFGKSWVVDFVWLVWLFLEIFVFFHVGLDDVDVRFV